MDNSKVTSSLDLTNRFALDVQGFDALRAAATGLAGEIVMPDMAPEFSAIVYAAPIQLLAYHTAVFMGKDVDQPRNLAKSVTVE